MVESMVATAARTEYLAYTSLSQSKSTAHMMLGTKIEPRCPVLEATEGIARRMRSCKLARFQVMEGWVHAPTGAVLIGVSFKRWGVGAAHIGGFPVEAFVNACSVYVGMVNGRVCSFEETLMMHQEEGPYSCLEDWIVLDPIEDSTEVSGVSLEMAQKKGMCLIRGTKMGKPAFGSGFASAARAPVSKSRAAPMESGDECRAADLLMDISRGGAEFDSKSTAGAFAVHAREPVGAGDERKAAHWLMDMSRGGVVRAAGAGQASMDGEWI